MDQYKTVKEVCALTGLTGKHLYYFHHENVVRAAAYANYSVEGNDGYKLYDEAGVEKLQQIALYYQLGLKRNEIRDIMLDPAYDSRLALDALSRRKQSERAQIERQIAALEFLKKVGIQNGIAAILDSLSRNAPEDGASRLQDACPQAPVGTPETQQLAASISPLLEDLRRLPENLLSAPMGQALIGSLFRTGEECLGADGKALVLGIFATAAGGGTLAVSSELTPAQGRAGMQYFAEHPELQAGFGYSLTGKLY